MSTIDLTSLGNDLPKDSDQNDRRDDDDMSICSYKADAPEDEQEFDELINFFATKRRVIDILYDHIFKHNKFVTRWKVRLSKDNARAAQDKDCPTASGKQRRGHFGNVEFACYEAWVAAHKDNDRSGMMNAIKKAMSNADDPDIGVGMKRKYDGF